MTKFALVFDTTSCSRGFIFEEYDAKCFWQLNYISVTYGIRFNLAWLTLDGEQVVSIPIIYEVLINYIVF